MYCVGLVGSVACGKSTVCRFFTALGIDTINADQIAKDLVEPNTVAFNAIVSHFGTSILTAEGTLNRRQLRARIVKTTEERLWLEALLHPLIRQRIEHDIQFCKSPYCIIEIPLLTSTEHYPYLNRILWVTAPKEQQISRLMQRDRCSEQQALELLKTTEVTTRAQQNIADDVLENKGHMDQLQQNVLSLHQQYLQLSQP